MEHRRFAPAHARHPKREKHCLQGEECKGEAQMRFTGREPEGKVSDDQTSPVTNVAAG